MAIEVIAFENSKKLMDQLEELALSNKQIVFRGHQDEKWKIESTYARYTTTPHRGWDTQIDEMLSSFLNNYSTLDTISFDVNNRRARLEFGRHHGVPTPVIDYSHSPYVALYFAFSGLQYKHNSAPKNAAIIALDLVNLGIAWSRLISTESSEAYSEFMNEDKEYFEKGYPANVLKYVHFSASWNRRMRNQLGCFVYNTVNYPELDPTFKSFDDWAASVKDPTSADSIPSVMVRKFLIPHSEASNVFSRLDIMGITGTRLLDREGFAQDVKNIYNHTPKTGPAWDLEISPPEGM